MFKSTEQFLKNWDYESEATGKLLGNLTDESLNQKVTPDGRSLGFIAWHIAQTIPEMLGKTGLILEGPAVDSKLPEKAAEIKKAFEKASASLKEQISSKWTDETLNLEDEMYGEKWKRGMTLSALILHQAHHRGQMTVLMRQAGLKVQGVYGPSREEWEAMGMEAME
jgi:uncharacterized damage-inducible protein DinB